MAGGAPFALMLREQGGGVHLEQRGVAGDNRGEGCWAVDVDHSREVFGPAVVFAAARVANADDLDLGVAHAAAKLS